MLYKDLILNPIADTFKIGGASHHRSWHENRRMFQKVGNGLRRKEEERHGVVGVLGFKGCSQGGPKPCFDWNIRTRF